VAEVMMRLLRIVTVLAILCASSSAGAQEVEYGVKGGINLATLSFDPEAEADFRMKIGLVVGGFASLPLGSRLSVQPEGLFSQKGTAVDDGDADAKITINYLEVPVLVKYAIARTASRTFHVFGGPSIAFKLSAESSATVGDQTIEDDIGEEIEDFDLGLVVGAGIDFGRLTVDGRYTFGFSNLAADEGDPQKARNRTVSILAGILF
jgi:Outer membrane protein beta-barrel domain